IRLGAIPKALRAGQSPPPWNTHLPTYLPRTAGATMSHPFAGGRRTVLETGEAASAVSRKALMSDIIIRVAVYYRMSTLKQEDSIDRQRSQVVAYAKARGYLIVAEYVDEGVAGDELRRRKEFQRPLRDAQTGQFDGILCDDNDRFGRFDSIDMGEIVAPLRRKGVWLESVAQGRSDWESFAGRVTKAVLDEAKS